MNYSGTETGDTSVLLENVGKAKKTQDPVLITNEPVMMQEDIAASEIEPGEQGENEFVARESDTKKKSGAKKKSKNNSLPSLEERHQENYLPSLEERHQENYLPSLEERHQENQIEHTLIVVPNATLIDHWIGEIKKMTRLLSCSHVINVYLGAKRTLRCASPLAREGEKEKVVVCLHFTTYHTAARDGPIKRKVWHRIVLDEAHKIRHSNSQISKAVCRLKAKRKWCITSTPYNNRLKDMWSICQFLDIEPYNQKRWWKRMNTLKRLWIANFVISRTHKELNTMSGTRLQHNIHLCDFEVEASYERSSAVHVLAQIGNNCRLSSVSHAPYASQWCNSYPHSHCIIVFVQYLNTMNAVYDDLKCTAWKYHGQLSKKQKKVVLREARQCTQKCVLVCTIQTLCCGVDLYFARHCFFVDETLNPFDDVQAIARLYRIGQCNDEVHVHHIVNQSDHTQYNLLLQQLYKLRESIKVTPWNVNAQIFPFYVQSINNIIQLFNKR